MSRVRFFSTGFFARASPGFTTSPSAIMRCDGIGSAYLRSSPSLPVTTSVGERFSVVPVVSTTIFCVRPVTLSVSSRRFSPSRMSLYATLPAISDRIGDANGSQLTRSWPGLTSSPSTTFSTEP